MAGLPGALLTGATLLERLWIFGPDDTAFDFDCVVREGITTELTVTDNPVETGVVVSDHAFMQPIRLEIEAVVSDNPLWNGRTSTYVKDSLVLKDGTPRVDVFGDGQRRSITAYEKIRNLQASAVPFTVVTGLARFPNMVIQSLAVEQDKDSSAVLSFRASLREVIIVSTQTVTYPPRADDKTKRQGSKKKTGGEKKTTDPGANGDSIMYGVTPDAVKAGFQKNGLAGALDALKAEMAGAK